jgi:hypothetical protein
VTKFDNKEVSKLAKIPVRACRGRRELLLPFLNIEAVLQEAPISAETVFEKAVEQDNIIDHCLLLKTIFEEEKRFSKKLDQMLRAWKKLTPIARNDLAELAGYFISIEEHGEDARSPESAGAIVAQFEQIIRSFHRAANSQDFFEDVPSKKKDRLNNRSVAPLREFVYLLKLLWDDTMRNNLGSEFDKVFPFSVAREIVFAAVGVLTKKYTKLDITRMIRSVQEANYNPESYRTLLPEGFSLLKIMRPQLAAPSP